MTGVDWLCGPLPVYQVLEGTCLCVKVRQSPQPEGAVTHLLLPPYGNDLQGSKPPLLFKLAAEHGHQDGLGVCKPCRGSDCWHDSQLHNFGLCQQTGQLKQDILRAIHLAVINLYLEPAGVIYVNYEVDNLLQPGEQFTL